MIMILALWSIQVSIEADVVGERRLASEKPRRIISSTRFLFNFTRREFFTGKELYDNDRLRCLIGMTMNLTNHRQISSKLKLLTPLLHQIPMKQQPPQHPGNASLLKLNTEMASEKRSP